MGLFAGAFDEYLESAVLELFVELFADLVLDLEEVIVSLFLDFVVDSVGEFFVGGCAGAWRVFEDEAVFVLCFSDEVDGGVEIFVGFAGEAYDEVAGNGNVRDDVSCTVEKIQIFGGGVVAVHGFEDTVGAALGGHVEVAADFGVVGHDGEDFFVKVSRV